MAELMISSPSQGKLTLTERAAQRILFLRQNKKNQALRLRLTVSGGGCAGFKYDFALDDQQTPEDCVFRLQEAEIVTDPTSLDIVTGSEIDFVENLMGSFFQLNNPRATSTCGCGTSFSTA